MIYQIEVKGNIYCEHCGERISVSNDITMEGNKIYHTECLPENLKEGN